MTVRPGASVWPLLPLALSACVAQSSPTGGGDAGTGPMEAVDAGSADATSSPDAAALGDAAVAGPTFHRDIEPILQGRCQICHRPGGAGPFSLLTYADAQPRAPLLMQATAARRMPPFGALSTDECTPRFAFRDDQHLTQAQIDLFAAWFGAGTPEGDPRDAPAPVSFDDDYGALEHVDATLEPESDYVVQGPNDELRCFVLDPHWTEQKWVTGVRFLPGNPGVVHHAITFLDPNRESLGLAGPDGSYECFASPQVSNTTILNAWAPGAGSGLLDPGAAMQVPANSLIVLQVHYHTLNHDGEADRSTVEIQLGDTRPEWVTQVLLLGNYGRPEANGDGLLPGDDDPPSGPAFVIPAGATHHAEYQRFTLPATIGGGYPVPDLKVVSVGTHMHYVGVDMKFDIEHVRPKMGEPERECMIETPVWNFQWQRSYRYDVDIPSAPEFRPGDHLLMRCVYDNSMDNPFVVEALHEQGLSAPREVRLGEQTLDEMCLAVLTIAYRNPF